MCLLDWCNGDHYREHNRRYANIQNTQQLPITLRVPTGTKKLLTYFCKKKKLIQYYEEQKPKQYTIKYKGKM